MSVTPNLLYIREIQTDASPTYELPFSQAVESNGFIYVSGQVPVDPKTNNIVSDDIRDQTAQTLENAASILEASDASLDDVVKTTLCIVNVDDFDDINEVYGKYFSQPYPARSAVEVSDLAIDVGIEIDIVAETDVDDSV